MYGVIGPIQCCQHAELETAEYSPPCHIRLLYLIKCLQILSLIHMRGSLIQLPKFSGIGRSVTVCRKIAKLKIMVIDTWAWKFIRSTTFPNINFHAQKFLLRRYIFRISQSKFSKIFFKIDESYKFFRRLMNNINSDNTRRI